MLQNKTLHSKMVSTSGKETIRLSPWGSQEVLLLEQVTGDSSLATTKPIMRKQRKNSNEAIIFMLITFVNKKYEWDLS